VTAEGSCAALPTPSAFEALGLAWYRSFVMSEPETDGDLLRRIAARDATSAAAERSLCLRFAPRVRLYGLRHLKTEERARDLVQAVLLAVLEAARAGRVQEPDHVDRFVLGTCRNLAFKAREAERRALPLPEDQLAEAAGAFEPSAVEIGPLVRCLATLDERSKHVVMLSYHEELRADEVAERLALTAGNVRVVRHRALAALRRCLEGSPS
jgi:RNA polymerase sigma-70 factor (ECF subfamily)